ncbi:hypothetical protein [Faecousia sp.]|jgi:hypothetical protein
MIGTFPLLYTLQEKTASIFPKNAPFLAKKQLKNGSFAPPDEK